MISYGDMLAAVETEEKKNVPAITVQTSPPKTEKEDIEEVIEEKEELDNEN